MKTLVFALTGALLLGGRPALAAEGGRQGKVYKTPQEVFVAFQAAGIKNDWQTGVACLTEVSQDTWVGFNAYFTVFLKNVSETIARNKAVDRTGRFAEEAKTLDQILSKHGIGPKALQTAGLERGAQFANLDESEAQKRFKKLADMVKDHAGFLHDWFATLKKLGKLPAQGPFIGELKDVKVQGNTATGKRVMPQFTHPIGFKKIEGSWKIEIRAGTLLPGNRN
jgi:hypothetical protein